MGSIRSWTRALVLDSRSNQSNSKDGYSVERPLKSPDTRPCFFSSYWRFATYTNESESETNIFCTYLCSLSAEIAVLASLGGTLSLLLIVILAITSNCSPSASGRGRVAASIAALCVTLAPGVSAIKGPLGGISTFPVWAQRSWRLPLIWRIALEFGAISASLFLVLQSRLAGWSVYVIRHLYWLVTALSVSV